MAAASEFCFGDYRLNLPNEQLWCGAQPVPLTTKALRVLGELVAHAGQLVTKDALFAAVWPGAAVSEGVLSNCIGELRKALGDSAQAPRCIQTVHRRGYRFLAPMTVATPPAPAPAVAWLPAALPRAPLLVGRDAEVATLHQHLVQARRGQRQMVLVSGEAGIGKTTVVDAFLATLAPEEPLWVAWGQCLAHYGSGEAYLPVLDALGRLGRTPAHAQLLPLLRQYAPTWVGQLPALVPAAAWEATPSPVPGATRERMLREAAECLEALSAVQPLILVLEDLHWSDHATLDLLTWLARRREPARLLVVGTYRPVEVLVHGHPLQAVKQELSLHGQCVELRLEGLSAAAVTAYLTARFPGSALATRLASVLHRRTEGQPLFMVQTVETWVQQGWVAPVAGQWAVQVGVDVVETGVAESVRQLIAQQCDGLPPAAQAVLEVASVVGRVWNVVGVAAGLAAPAEQMEAQCVALARQGQFVEAGPVVTGPDGTVGESYQFRHALYQQVVYDRIPVGRQRQLHRRIGLWKEAGYGARGVEGAAELAMHFAQGGEDARAVTYLHQAGDRALTQSACREAIAYFEQALRTLAQLPETRETRAHAIDLWLALRAALQPMGELDRVWTCLRTAETLAAALDDAPRLARVSLLLSRYFSLTAQYTQAITAAQHALQCTTAGGDAVLQALAHLNLGLAYHAQGAYRRARACFQQTVGALDGARSRALYGQTILPAVHARTYLAWCHAELGRFATGQALGHTGLQMAEAVGHPGSRMVAWWGVGLLARRQGDLRRALPPLDRAMHLCHEADLPMWFPAIAGELGAAYLLDGRVAAAVPLLTQALEQALAARQASAQVALGEAHLRAGHLEDAHTLTEDALADARARHERGCQAAALRLLGEIATQSHPSDVARAETAYRQALALAEALGMRPLQAHCHRGLGTLYAATGQREQARSELTTAIAMYQSMEMTFWLPETEAALAQVDA